ncbi:MAG: TlpA family protein disulfide reductase [Stellaceae bacterium]
MTRTLPLRAMALAAIVAAGACLALWGGYEFGPQLFPAGPSGQSAAGFGKNPFALQVLGQPRPMPALEFADRNGRPLTLGAFRGRVVLLNIWATWCVPCRQEMPALNRLEAALGGKDFTVLPLSIDHAGVPAVERFYRQLGLTRLGIYVDPSARAAGALALPGVPTSFLIDAEGREVARKIGPAAWDGPQMTALIRRYLPPERQKAGP